MSENNSTITRWFGSDFALFIQRVRTFAFDELASGIWERGIEKSIIISENKIIQALITILKSELMNRR